MVLTFAYFSKIKQISVKIATKNNFNISKFTNLIKKQKLKSKKNITTSKLENFLIKKSNYLEILKFQNRNKEFITKLLILFENEEYSKKILHNKIELYSLIKMIDILALESKCEKKLENYMFIDTWKCEAMMQDNLSSGYSDFCSCFYPYTCMDYEEFNYQYLTVNTLIDLNIDESSLEEYIKTCEDQIFNLTQVKWNCEFENIINENQNYIEQNCNCSREKFCEFQKIIQI